MSFLITMLNFIIFWSLLVILFSNKNRFSLKKALLCFLIAVLAYPLFLIAEAIAIMVLMMVLIMASPILLIFACIVGVFLPFFLLFELLDD